MFSLNEKVVYPGHGVALIIRIIERKVAGLSTQFFELKFINKDMTILVPLHNMEAVGIRALSSKQDLDAVCSMLTQPVELQETSVNWTKRNKDYQGKIRTGDLREIGEIYRDLRTIEHYKELSFGEKNLLHQTEMLLAEEFSIVLGIRPADAIEQLRVLAHIKHKVSPPPSHATV